MFEECDPRPEVTGEDDVDRVTFGGSDEQVRQAKALVRALSTVLCEDLTKLREESKAPLFRIDLKEGFRQRRQ